jgi:hypothetical protein
MKTPAQRTCTSVSNTEPMGKALDVCNLAYKPWKASSVRSTNAGRHVKRQPEPYLLFISRALRPAQMTPMGRCPDCYKYTNAGHNHGKNNSRASHKRGSLCT